MSFLANLKDSRTQAIINKYKNVATDLSDTKYAVIEKNSVRKGDIKKDLGIIVKNAVNERYNEIGPVITDISTGSIADKAKFPKEPPMSNLGTSIPDLKNSYRINNIKGKYIVYMINDEYVHNSAEISSYVASESRLVFLFKLIPTTNLDIFCLDVMRTPVGEKETFNLSAYVEINSKMSSNGDLFPFLNHNHPLYSLFSYRYNEALRFRQSIRDSVYIQEQIEAQKEIKSKELEEAERCSKEKERKEAIEREKVLSEVNIISTAAKEEAFIPFVEENQIITPIFARDSALEKDKDEVDPLSTMLYADNKGTSVTTPMPSLAELQQLLGKFPDHPTQQPAINNVQPEKTEISVPSLTQLQQSIPTNYGAQLNPSLTFPLQSTIISIQDEEALNSNIQYTAIGPNDFKLYHISDIDQIQKEYQVNFRTITKNEFMRNTHGVNTEFSANNDNLSGELENEIFTQKSQSFNKVINNAVAAKIKSLTNDEDISEKRLEVEVKNVTYIKRQFYPGVVIPEITDTPNSSLNNELLWKPKPPSEEPINLFIDQDGQIRNKDADDENIKTSIEKYSDVFKEIFFTTSDGKDITKASTSRGHMNVKKKKMRRRGGKKVLKKDSGGIAHAKESDTKKRAVNLSRRGITQPICGDYQRGKCTREDCRYKHIERGSIKKQALTTGRL